MTHLCGRAAQRYEGYPHHDWVPAPISASNAQKERINQHECTSNHGRPTEPRTNRRMVTSATSIAGNQVCTHFVPVAVVLWPTTHSPTGLLESVQPYFQQDCRGNTESWDDGGNSGRDSGRDLPHGGWKAAKMPENTPKPAETGRLVFPPYQPGPIDWVSR